MSKKKYIKASNSSPSLPVISTITIWLFLDRLHINGVKLGVLWTIWGLLCLIWIINFIWKMFWWESADPVYKDEE